MPNVKVEFPPDTLEEIRTAYLNGTSTIKLAIRYDVSQPVISRVLRENGVEIRPWTTKIEFSPEQLKNMKLMRLGGMEVREIADTYGVSEALIYKHLRKMSVKLDRPLKRYQVEDLKDGRKYEGTAREMAQVTGLKKSLIYTLASQKFKSAYLGRYVVTRLEEDEDGGF